MHKVGYCQCLMYGRRIDSLPAVPGCMEPLKRQTDNVDCHKGARPSDAGTTVYRHRLALGG